MRIEPFSMEIIPLPGSLPGGNQQQRPREGPAEVGNAVSGLPETGSDLHAPCRTFVAHLNKTVCTLLIYKEMVGDPVLPTQQFFPYSIGQGVPQFLTAGHPTNPKRPTPGYRQRPRDVFGHLWYRFRKYAPRCGPSPP